MGGMDKINNRVYPLGKGMVRQPQKINSEGDKSFQEALKSATRQLDVTLSKHARLRMQDRRIHLNNSQVERLNMGVSKARNKGIRDTLVLLDDKVFVVNVKNNTVITATGGKDIKEKVFTNIDGAVIV